MTGIRLEHVTKRFKEEVAVDDVSLEIADREFLVILGPSGCGKTTTLRMIAGLEVQTSGHIYIGDMLVDDYEPRDRNIGMVFQSYALYPHMRVADNIAFGLKMRRTPKEEIRRRVHEVAVQLDIVETLGRRPAELSGGQRQRVALARAIVRDPEAFLLDEPLSNLDAKIRTSARIELKRIHQQLGGTFVFVTHDQVEAMTLADRLAIMNHGRLLQCDTPEQVLKHPVNQFVGSFVGSPELVIIEGAVESAGTTSMFVRGPVRLRVRGGSKSGPVTMGLRPWDISVGRTPAPDRIPAKVIGLERTGSSDQLFLELASPSGVPAFTVRALVKSYEFNVGESVTVELDASRALFFDGEGNRIDSMSVAPSPA